MEEEETVVTDWDNRFGWDDLLSLLFEDPIPNNIVDNNEGQPPLDVIENLPFNDEFFNDIFVTESPAPPDVVVDDRQQKDAPPDVAVVDDRQQKDAPPDVSVVDDRQQKDAPPDVAVVDDRQQKDAPPDVAVVDDRQQKDAPPDVVVVDDRQQKEEDNSHKDDPLAKERKRQSYVKELEMKSSFYEAEYRRLTAENQALRFSLHSSKLIFDTTSITRQASAPLFLGTTPSPIALLTEQQEVLPEPGKQPLLENDRDDVDDVRVSKDAPPDVVVVDNRQQKDAPPDVVVVDDRQQKDAPPDVVVVDNRKQKDAPPDVVVVDDRQKKDARPESADSADRDKSSCSGSHSVSLRDLNMELMWNKNKISIEKRTVPLSSASRYLTPLSVSRNEEPQEKLYLPGSSRDASYLSLSRKPLQISSITVANTKPLKRGRKRKIDSLTIEAVEKHVGKPISQAAESFGVSKSTLKRFCRKNGLAGWPKPSRGKKHSHATDPKLSQQCLQRSSSRWFAIRLVVLFVVRVNRLSSSGRQMSYSEHSYLPCKSDTKYQVAQLMVKATFKGDMTKFRFPVSSGLSELENEVAQRLDLKGVRLGIKYKDEENDLLITCDDVLHSLPEFLATNTTVKLSCFLVL